MLFQLCLYKTMADEPFKAGIAKMQSGFNCPDIIWIVDGKTGKKIAAKDMYNYELQSNPLAYLATSLQAS